jgi:hypothetical protein
MPRVLIVAWLFPPHASVGTRRPYRLARHLPSLGWDVTVLTQASVPERLRERAADELALPAAVRVVRAYDPPLLARAVAALDAHAANEQKKSSAHASASSLSFAERWIPTEPAALWAPHAALRAALDGERYDAVLSTSYPFSAHAVAKGIASLRKIPWVADLRDPWTLHFSHARKHPIARSIERLLERDTFESATSVTVTTEALRDAYRLRFTRQSDHIHAVHNSFDPVPLPARERSPGPARLVHFGHVYGGARTLVPVLEALASIAKDRSLTDADVVLENYGRFSDEDRARARALGVESLLRIREPVAYADGMASLRSASLLLLPTWDSEFGPLFLPAKLFDYLHVAAPILAIGANPELGAILAKTQSGSLCAADDAAAIRASIDAAIDGRAAVEPIEREVERFSSRAMAERFAWVLDEARARATIAAK